MRDRLTEIYNTITEEDIFITNDDPSKEQKYAAFFSRREFIAGESPIPVLEDTSMSYSGLEPTRLQAACHNHHTGWLGSISLICIFIFEVISKQLHV
ncbi:hypothetical protein TNCV_1189961 [Trichonephila clavipes]|nr:hypothetical protein TNCV_1189961 [Trichonephila clavipes]